MSPDQSWQVHSPGSRVLVDGKWGIVSRVLSETPPRFHVWLDVDTLGAQSKMRLCEYAYGSLHRMVEVGVLDQLADIE
jgi:hypothetical protein